MTPEELSGLAERAARRDEVAFRALIDATHGLVYRVSLRLIGDHASAEDIVQETFVRAWQKLDTLRDTATVTAWLCRIASNLARDRLRAQRVRPKVFDNDDDAARAIERLHSDAPGADSLVNSREVRVVVRAAVASLDERFRVVLLLKDVDGMSAPDIAKLLDIPVGTVESRASRARDQLGKKLMRLSAQGRL